MKYIFCFLFHFLAIGSFAQTDLDSVARSIEEEASILYRSEMASWYGTDIFIEKLADKKEITGGYFSYTDQNKAVCIFYSKDENPKVIATATFDGDVYSTKTGKIRSEERSFSDLEAEYYVIRKKALELANNDTIFKTYKNTNLNLIPVITNKKKRVFILTGASVSNLVVLGNDYLIEFDENNEILKYRTLHKNILQFNYYKPQSNTDDQEVISMHSHVQETGDFILATDICTLRLYAKFAKWKQHYVISKNYVSLWDCGKNKLVILTKEAWEKIGGKE